MTEQEQVLWGGPSGSSAEPVLLTAVESIRSVLARPGYAFSNAEVLENLRAVHRLIAAAESVKLALVAELTTRPDAVPGAGPGKAAYAFLTEALRVSGPRAARDVAAADALASASPTLPRMAQAPAEGEVSRDHVDVAVSTLRSIPKALKTKMIEDDDPDRDDTPDAAAPDGEPDPPAPPRTGADVIDEVLTGQARQLPPTTVERLGRQIVHRLDPDRTERFDPDAYQRRHASHTSDYAGMGLWRLHLDPATDAQVQAIIAAAAKPLPAGTAVDEHGSTIPVRDTRTPGQRMADAIADLILAHATPAPADPDDPIDDPIDDQPATPAADDSSGTTGRATASQPVQSDRSDRPQDLPAGVFLAKPCRNTEISVIATLDQLAAAYGADNPAAVQAGLARMSLAGPIGTFPGATLAPAVLARLACDTPIRRILINDQGAILHHGRGKRFATEPQRRALAARDGGCVIPGCPAPPEWCEAHHTIPWDDGGLTNIDTMALLCGRHHTAHHAGTYHIHIRDGIAWVRPPQWQQHPDRPWLRNATSDHHRLANTTAQTLTHQQQPLWHSDPPHASGRAA